MKRKCFQIHNSKILDAYNKNCWFYEWAKLSYFTFKNGQDTGTEYILSVCVFRFVYTLPLRRNSGVKKMSSDSESNSFAHLSRISDEDITEEDLEDIEESLTHKLTSRVDAT